MRSPWVVLQTDGARGLGLALAYALTAWLGLQLSYDHEAISLFWPPSGIAVGALLRWGWRYWPAIYLGALAINGVNNLASGAVLIAATNTLAPLMATFLLRRARIDPTFSHRRDVLHLLQIAPLTMTISATGGALAISLISTDGWATFVQHWLVWWLGDTVGVLLFTPLLLGFDGPALARLAWERWRELAALWTLALGTGLLVLLNPLIQGDHAVTLFLLLLPIQIWACLRFPLSIAMLLAAGLAGLAAQAALWRIGPFAVIGHRQGYELIWLFMTVMTIMALLITALQGERQAFERSLSAMLAQRTALLDTLGEGVLVVDREGRYLAHNRQFITLWRLPAELLESGDWAACGELIQRQVENPEHLQQLIGRESQASNSTFWDEIQLREGRLLEWRARPFEVAGAVAGTVISYRDVTERYQLEQALRTTNRRLVEALAEVERLADTDKLTGVWNRRRFDVRLHEEMERCQRYCQPLALVLLDIDHFKQVNDTYGHAIGDQALITVAQTIAGQLRASDTLARWGGEEFVVLTPLALSDALALAEKLRQLVAAQHIPPLTALSISLGVAESRRGESGEDLLRRADAALYRAKTAGRNRVMAAD